ncbi:MAG: prepilin-type N-terminal cleavage/methylation domain-containing protein [Opitutaceae bacterium]
MTAPRRASPAFTLVEIMVVVVMIGLLAALALPAFARIRVASQDKAVLNNARQLAYAADSYYLETGANYASSSALVGGTLYVKSLSVVANETYPSVFTQGVTVTVTGVGGARTITYSP